MTETSPAVCVLAKKDHTKYASVGRPVFDTEIKVVDVDDKNKSLKENEIGELTIKGPQVNV